MGEEENVDELSHGFSGLLHDSYEIGGIY